MIRAVVLALAAAATVAGMKGYTAIAGWVGDVATAVVAQLYARVGAAPVGWPSRTTISARGSYRMKSLKWADADSLG